jgi:predicted Zn-dependent protease
MILLAGSLLGCAAPRYAIRQSPMPIESSEVIEIEQTISAYQAKQFERKGATPLEIGNTPSGLRVQAVVERLSRVTERPHLSYQAVLYRDRDPNAAALADGRIYLSTGMLDYVASRGAREDELAVVIAHELAHTAAQHLIKRYQMLQQQNLLLTVLSAGTAAVTGDAGGTLQEVGRLAKNVAGLLSEVATSGYSQDQELEADQLGIRYILQAGYDPRAALDLLRDFSQFDDPLPFLRTHPYMQTRLEHLERYLADTAAAGPGPDGAGSHQALRQRLLDAQRLYPTGSVSRQNLQRQLDQLPAD